MSTLEDILDAFVDMSDERQRRVIQKVAREDEGAADILRNLRQMQKRTGRMKDLADEIGELLPD